MKAGIFMSEEQIKTGRYDSPWKFIIGRYFREFMDFFFPDASKKIDWSVPYEFLDKEFESFIGESEMSKCIADKLVKVFLKGGGEIFT